jgi:hypothetical protein
MKKYNAMFDVAFSVVTKFVNSDNIPMEVLLDGLEKRLNYLKANRDECADAFGFCDQFELDKNTEELP